MDKLTMERLRPIRDEVYYTIRKAILRGQYKPGERLQEEELSETLGTSRTPVREALRKLEVEKIVVHYPHRGTVVAELPMNEVDDLYEIRKFIEVIIARRAAEMATDEDIRQLESLMEKEEAATDHYEIMDLIDEYNTAIAAAANCPAIADICTKVRETLGRMIVYEHTRPERRKNAQKDHRDIVAAIAARDVELAQELTSAHIENGCIIVNDYRSDAKPARERSTLSDRGMLGERGTFSERGMLGERGSKRGFIYGDWPISDWT